MIHNVSYLHWTNLSLFYRFPHQVARNENRIIFTTGMPYEKVREKSSLKLVVEKWHE